MLRWWKDVGLEDEWLDAALTTSYLRWTPEATKYKGARHRAVALGLLALSCVTHDPPKPFPSREQLRACAHVPPEPGCAGTARGRALARMMWIGEYADTELFNQMMKRWALEGLEREGEPTPIP